MKNRTGFTLIELVVVVMILGILAAVAAPKLLGTSSAATDNGVKQTLAVVRDAIERYAAENGGQKPGADADPDTFKSDLADYLRGAFPICPVGAKNDVIAIDLGSSTMTGPASPAAEAWKYQPATGDFIINWSAPTAMDGDSATYDQL